jgi:HSP20 family protein
MKLERRNPGRDFARTPFQDLHRHMDQILRRFLRGSPEGQLGQRTADWFPAVDVINRNAEVVVRVDLPGLEDEDVEVRVAKDILTIRGRRETETEEGNDEYYTWERWAGAFSRSLSLPPGVEAEKVTAAFTRGVLEISLPKTKKAKGKKVAV